jgi:hypothetical protein
MSDSAAEERDDVDKDLPEGWFRYFADDGDEVSKHCNSCDIHALNISIISYF